MRKRGEKHNNRSFKKSFCDDNIITECTLNFFSMSNVLHLNSSLERTKKTHTHTQTNKTKTKKHKIRF